MKKFITLIAGCMAAMMLAGCEDATAKLSSPRESVMKIGNKTITKGELYEAMFSSGAADAAYNDALKSITAKEVEVTDDMKDSAESNVSYSESYYGKDRFANILKAMGMTREEYVENAIASLQADELPKQYVNDNFDNLCGSYDPIKATILTFSSEDDANKALSQLRDGSATAAEAAKNNNSTSTGTSELITMNTTSYDSAALTVIRSNSPDDGWSMVPSSEEGTYYVLRVDDNDPNNYKDDIVDALSQIDTVKNRATTYYFHKYNFHIYDINLKNAMTESYPSAVVQDMNFTTPTPSADSSASPESTASASAQSTASASAESN